MKNKIIYILSMSLFTLACTPNQNSKSAKTNVPKDSTEQLYMLIGSYNSGINSNGIYVYRFNQDTGTADSVSSVAISNPSYLTFSEDEKRVYSVTENGINDSRVNAFNFDKSSGTLTLINNENTDGADPCFIETDNAGKFVLTADYSGGTISVFGIRADGGITPLIQSIDFKEKGKGKDPERQTQSHIHSVRFSPDHKYLLVSDLGLDKLYRYTLPEAPNSSQLLLYNQNLKEFDVSYETGPRHFDFHPNGNYFYLLGELSGKISVFNYNNGDLRLKQTIVADSIGARGSADIHISPDGNFLYASNRLKSDGLAIFSISAVDGTLTKVAYQHTKIHPRNFVISPNGKFLLVACRDSNLIQIFERHIETGLLTETARSIEISKPVCIKFAAIN